MRQAYEALAADDRAGRHTARAATLAALGEPSHRLGAIPYHLEHGTDPLGAGVTALAAACEECFGLGCYDAALELAVRGRELAAAATDQHPYWTFTYKAGACLSTLQAGYFRFRLLHRVAPGHRRPQCPHERLLHDGHAVHPLPPAR